MMDVTPNRIDRPALERIIQRAAELQAGEREIGEGLTESELMRLGEDVGIPTPYLRQALLEERTRVSVPAQHGLTRWLAGPKLVTAQRTVVGEAQALEAALARWMNDGELLRVKRRYPQQTSWEAQKGTIVSLKRSFGIGGRQYALAGAREIVGQVVDVGEGRCHVRLVADLTNSFGERVWGAGLLTAAGAVTSVVLGTLGFATAFAALPIVAAVPAAGLIARGRHKDVERVQVALEQVLDRLEHGVMRGEPALQAGRPSTFGRVVDEIKRNLEI
jgi:hypothetical protein